MKNLTQLNLTDRQLDMVVNAMSALCYINAGSREDYEFAYRSFMRAYDREEMLSLYDQFKRLGETNPTIKISFGSKI